VIFITGPLYTTVACIVVVVIIIIITYLDAVAASRT